MRATIDLPDSVFAALQSRATLEASSVEAVILQVIESAIAPQLAPADGQRRVQLPLVQSKRPGTLGSMTGAEIDNLLG